MFAKGRMIARKEKFSNWWMRYLSWNECQWTLQMVSQYWCRLWFWCRQVIRHYLSQCWPSRMSSYGVTRPQWVNDFLTLCCTSWRHILHMKHYNEAYKQITGDQMFVQQHVTGKDGKKMKTHSKRCGPAKIYILICMFVRLVWKSTCLYIKLRCIGVKFDEDMSEYSWVCVILYLDRQTNKPSNEYTRQNANFGK